MKKIIPTLTLFFGLTGLSGCTSIVDDPFEEDDALVSSGVSVEERDSQAESSGYQKNQVRNREQQKSQAQSSGYQEGQTQAYLIEGQAERDFQGKSWDNPTHSLSERIIYFAYDSSSIEPQYRELIQNHIRYLFNNPSMTILLEGHTDERGSREYNIALGEQRALAVRQIMVIQGVSREQLQSISFGEEKPQAFGHDEQTYHKNRRVELVYVEY